MNKESLKELLFIWALTVACTCAIPSSHAASVNWKGTTSGLWNVGTNWTATPVSGDTLNFGNGSSTNTLTDNLMTPGTFNVAGIFFNSFSSSYTINSATPGTNGFTLTGNQIWNTSTSATVTINDAIILGSSQTQFLTQGTNSSLAFGGNLSETAAGHGLYIFNAGTTTLSGQNSFTGATLAEGVRLVLDYSTNDNNKLGATSSGLTLENATVELKGGTFAQAVGTNTTLIANSLNTVTRSSGAATLGLGAIVRNNGSGINFAQSGIATTSTSNVNGILGGWATLGGTDWATNAAGTGTGAVTALASYTDVTNDASGTKVISSNGPSNVRITNGLGGSASNLTLGSSTTQINSLNQNSSATATLDPAGQTLQVGAILVGTGKGALTVGSGSNNGTLSAASAGGELILNNQSSNLLTVNSVIADNTTASSLTALGSGTTVLAGANNYTGVTNVTGGTLQLSGAGKLSNAATFVTNGGTLNIGTTTQSIGALTLGTQNSSGAVTLSTGGVLNLGGDITTPTNSSGNLNNPAGDTISGGTLNLNGNHNILGNFAGLLTVSSTIADGSTASSLFLINGTKLVLTGNNTFTGQLGFGPSAGTVQIAGSGSLGAGSNFGNTITGSGTLLYSSSANQTLAGNIVGTGKLTKDTSSLSVLTLSGTNSYSGATTVSAGTLVFRNTFAKSASTTVTAAAGATIGLGVGGSGFYSDTDVGNLFNTNTLSGFALNASSGVAIDTTTGNFTESTALIAARALTKLGTNTLTLSGANSYTGGTNLAAGTLAFTGTGLGSSGAVTFTGNSTLQYGTATTTDLSARLAIANGVTGTVDTNGNNVTFATGFGASGSGALTKIGTGTLSLNAANTYTGLTTVNAGTLAVGSGGSLASGNALTLGASGAATFANAGQTLGAVSNDNTTSNALNFTAATGTVTLASLSGLGNTRFGSDGIVSGGISAGTVTSVGNLTANIAGGTTTVGGVATIGTLSGGTANLNGATSAITTFNGGTVNLGSSTALTVSDGTSSGTIAGTGGSLTKTSSGTLTLNGTNTYTGGTNLNAGTLNFTTGGLGTTGSVTFTGNSTLQYGASTTTDLSSRLAIGNGFTGTIDTNGNNVTFANGFGASGSGALTKLGTGTLSLNAANTYTGLTTVSAGSLAVGSGGSLASGNALTLGPSGLATFDNVGQTLGAVSNSNTTSNALNFSASSGTVTLANLSGAGSTTFGSNGIVTGGISTGSVTSVGNLTANISGGTTTVGGLLTGNISAGTVGASSLSATTVSGGSNTITGAAGITTLSNGTTTVGDVATIGTLSGGTANLNGATSAITTLNGGTVNLGSSTALTVSNGTSPGTITGTGGSLTKTSFGTLTLNGTNTYTGGTNIGAGTVNFTTGGLGTTGAVTFTGNSILQYGASTTTDLSSRLAINNGFTGTVDTNGNNVTFASGFGASGSGALTKIGSGTLTLNGTNTYTGLTTVNAGTFSVGGSGSLASGSALAVGASGLVTFANAGQTLGAVTNDNTATNALNFSASSGTVTLASLSGAGNTTFGSNGIVTGGIASGTVTATGNLTANISGGTTTVGGLLTGNISSGTVGAGSLSATTVSGGTTTITGSAGITTLSNGTTTVGGVATIGTLSGGTANLNGTTSAITTLTGGTVNLGSSTTLTVSGGTTSGAITGTGGQLLKAGTGSLTLTGANTYTGATNISAGTLSLQATSGAAMANTSGVAIGSGATLALGAANQINSSATLALTGGTLALHGFNQNLGTLTLGANSAIDFTGSAALVFADSSGLNWNSALLSISNFSITTNSLRFGLTGSGVDATQLSLIRFVEFGNSAARIDANGFLAPLNLNYSNTGAADLVITNPITGTTSVDQTGTGTTTLTAPASTPNTSTGLASVTQGTLVIGTAAGGNWAGSVTVSGTGTLKGRGDIGGAVVINAGGTYSPGNSPAIQHVGSLTVNTGSFVTIELDGLNAGNGTGFHDQVVSAGAVTLNGGTLSGSTVFTGSSGYLPTLGAVHAVLTGSAVTGTFAAYNFASNPAGISFLPEYTANAVNLYAVPSNYATAVAGLNANETQVGAALQSLRLSSPLFELDQRAALDARATLFNGLKTKDAVGLRTAYDQLTPEKITALSATTFQSSSILNSAIVQRSAEIRRFGPAAVSLNGVALPSPVDERTMETVIEDGVHYQIAKTQPKKQVGYFASATGAFAAVDGSTDRFGSFTQTGAASCGFDYALNDSQSFGLVVSQALADTDFSYNSGTAHTATSRLGVFHDYHNSGFFVNTSVTAGFSAYDSKRKIAFLNQTTSGETQGMSYGGQLSTGYDFKVEDFILGPTASVAYDDAHINGFEETGSAADLRVGRQNSDSLITKMGVHVSHPFVCNKIGWIPDVSLSASRQSFKPNSITARLAAGGDAFSINPQATGNEYINPGASLSALLPNGWTVRLSYDAILNRDSAEHRVNLSLNAGF